MIKLEYQKKCKNVELQHWYIDKYVWEARSYTLGRKDRTLDEWYAQVSCMVFAKEEKTIFSFVNNALFVRCVISVQYINTFVVYYISIIPIEEQLIRLNYYV